jgi:hypothetical protein
MTLFEVAFRIVEAVVEAIWAAHYGSRCQYRWCPMIEIRWEIVRTLTEHTHKLTLCFLVGVIANLCHDHPNHYNLAKSERN